MEYICAVFNLVATIFSCTGTITCGEKEYLSINISSIKVTFSMCADRAPGLKCFGVDVCNPQKAKKNY